MTNSLSIPLYEYLDFKWLTNSYSYYPVQNSVIDKFRKKCKRKAVSVSKMFKTRGNNPTPQESLRVYIFCGLHLAFFFRKNAINIFSEIVVPFWNILFASLFAITNYSNTTRQNSSAQYYFLETNSVWDFNKINIFLKSCTVLRIDASVRKSTNEITLA